VLSWYIQTRLLVLNHNKLSNYMAEKLILSMWFIKENPYLLVHPLRFFLWQKIHLASSWAQVDHLSFWRCFPFTECHFFSQRCLGKAIVRNHLSVMNLLTLTRVNKMDIHHINFIHKWSLATENVTAILQCRWGKISRIVGEMYAESFHGRKENQ